MFSQIPATTTAAIITAAIAGTVAIIKKLLPPKHTPKPDHITRQEFHQAMDDMRDRIAAANKEIEHRLDRIESAIARLDERTKI